MDQLMPSSCITPARKTLCLPILLWHASPPSNCSATARSFPRCHREWFLRRPRYTQLRGPSSGVGSSHLGCSRRRCSDAAVLGSPRKLLGPSTSPLLLERT